MAPLATIGLVVIVVIVAVGLRRLGRRPDPVTWAETGDNRLFGRPPTVEPPGSDPATPSRLWSETSWSLPRDSEEVGGAPPDGGERHEGGSKTPEAGDVPLDDAADTASPGDPPGGA